MFPLQLSEKQQIAYADLKYAGGKKSTKYLYVHVMEEVLNFN